jgi:predicted nuclease with TOPRIM domain
MPDDPDNLILNLLRAIRGDISQIKGDIIEIKERLGFLEGSYASLSRRVDRLGGDVERIKVRLDIVDSPVN